MFFNHNVKPCTTHNPHKGHRYTSCKLSRERERDERGEEGGGRVERERGSERTRLVSNSLFSYRWLLTFPPLLPNIRVTGVSIHPHLYSIGNGAKVFMSVWQAFHQLDFRTVSTNQQGTHFSLVTILQQHSLCRICLLDDAL